MTQVPAQPVLTQVEQGCWVRTSLSRDACGISRCVVAPATSLQAPLYAPKTPVDIFLPEIQRQQAKELPTSRIRNLRIVEVSRPVRRQ
jgi:hypothetical protein